MQINLNTINKNQNFGMAMKFTQAAQDILKSPRLKDNDIDKLGDLVASQIKNPVKIDIDRIKNKTLTAEIYDGKRYYECLADSYFNIAFGSPIKFIEKCCQKADMYRAKYHK